jgi:3,4-dihydroxy 2-butanone 4-phosphate synthase/GTP cyclohydrolase II
MAHSTTSFTSSLGQFVLHGFSIDGREHAALVCGSPELQAAPLVRIQSSCLTGSAFLAELCDCRQQLHEAMRLVSADGNGIVVYLDQEGRGHGLVEKVAQLDMITKGSDTVDAPALRGLAGDLRRYEDAAAILETLIGPAAIRLLTNNPTKITGMRDAGVVIAERVPLETPPTEGNRTYLRVKKTRMGHLLEQV